MLAEPWRSRVVLLNVTRGAAGEAFLVDGLENLTSLSVCCYVFAMSQLAVGEFDRASLSNNVAGSLEQAEVNLLRLWQASALEGRRSGVDVAVLTGLPYRTSRHQPGGGGCCVSDQAR